MGCNCKGESIDSMLEGTKEKISIGGSIIKYSLKLLVFAFFILLLPIVMLVITWLAFSMIVLNSSVDIKPILLSIGKKFQDKNDDDYLEDDFASLTEMDVVLDNVEDITPKSK